LVSEPWRITGPQDGVAIGVAVAVAAAVEVAVAVAVGVGVGVKVGVGVGIGLGATTQYLPPVFKPKPPPIAPPQTIIWLPVHTAVSFCRPAGAPVVLVAVQLSVPGLYRPPVFK
jgi:hypothetical protein